MTFNHLKNIFYISLLCILFLLISISCKSKSSTRNITTDITQTAEAKKVSATILDYGIYSASGGKKIIANNTASGVVTSYDATSQVDSTDTIKINQGIIFGFRYSLVDFPDNDSNPEVTIKVLHPEIKNPETNKSWKISTWKDNVFTESGSKNTAGWAFEKNWEEVPGDWTIQVFYKKNLLAEKKFKVTKNE